MLKNVIDFSQMLIDIKDVKIFFGKYDGIQRYDRFKYPVTKKLIELQQAQKWFPKELNYQKDKITIATISKPLASIYQDNIAFQTVADSLANRYLDNVLSEYITSPEWENVIKWQANFELLHSESYSHTIREVYGDAEKFFNETLNNPVIQQRLEIENRIYSSLDTDIKDDNLPLIEKKKALLESLFAQYILENVRFMVSFLYTFKINDVTDDGIKGTANSIALILNDETIHTVIFKHLINILQKYEEEGFTELFTDPAHRKGLDEMVHKLYRDVVESEIQWFNHLSSYEELPGMTEKAVREFLYYYANYSLKQINFSSPFEEVEANELVDFFEKKRRISNKKILAQENDATSYTIAALEDLDEKGEMSYSDMIEETLERMGFYE
jgi:ribonucleotide reductase beta subunit family protein with ferritin-like domain